MHISCFWAPLLPVAYMLCFFVLHVHVYAGSSDYCRQSQLVKGITGSLVDRLSEQVSDSPIRSEGP